MIAVLDVSAAVEILLNKREAPILIDKIASAGMVISPDLYISEMTDVSWKYFSLENFSVEDTLSFAEDGIKLIDYFIPSEDLWKESLHEAIKNNHPVYDALYAVCARRHAGMVLTLDKRLKSLCISMRVDCC